MVHELTFFAIDPVSCIWRDDAIAFEQYSHPYGIVHVAVADCTYTSDSPSKLKTLKNRNRTIYYEDNSADFMLDINGQYIKHSFRNGLSEKCNVVSFVVDYVKWEYVGHPILLKGVKINTRVVELDDYYDTVLDSVMGWYMLTHCSPMLTSVYETAAFRNACLEMLDTACRALIYKQNLRYILNGGFKRGLRDIGSVLNIWLLRAQGEVPRTAIEAEWLRMCE